MTQSDNSSQLSEEQLRAVLACEELLGYRFKDRNFLSEAITHASVANSRLLSYERLEFLGDSILGFTVCEYLFDTYPDWLEGELTQVKSNVVSRESCAQIGRDLQLETCIIVGKGVGSRGRVPKSLLANAVESIIAAIYLDGGLEVVKGFLLPLIIPKVDETIAGDFATNYKAELQQYAQKRYGVPPNYELIDARGPDHEKWFKISAKVNKKSFPPSWGKNKKQAEQRAAANALAAINNEEIPYPED
ncbi:MAG: ribonuclease III [Planctomycetota bacterium]